MSLPSLKTLATRIWISPLWQYCKIFALKLFAHTPVYLCCSGLSPCLPWCRVSNVMAVVWPMAQWGSCLSLWIFSRMSTIRISTHWKWDILSPINGCFPFCVIIYSTPIKLFSISGKNFPPLIDNLIFTPFKMQADPLLRLDGNFNWHFPLVAAFLSI